MTRLRAMLVPAVLVLAACNAEENGDTSDATGGSTLVLPTGTVATGGRSPAVTAEGGRSNTATATTDAGLGGTANGGATHRGTTLASGGIIETGTWVGGSSNTGGTTAKGGSSSTGGVTAKGGSSSTGGTTARGGSSSTGGTTSSYCGGFAALQCDTGQFCLYAIDANCGNGDQMGKCVAYPQVCPNNVAPVCGCNGITYGNECAARVSGISVASEGACSKP